MLCKARKIHLCRKIHKSKHGQIIDKRGVRCYIDLCNYDEKIIANLFDPFLNGLAAKESVPEKEKTS